MGYARICFLRLKLPEDAPWLLIEQPQQLKVNHRRLGVRFALVVDQHLQGDGDPPKARQLSKSEQVALCSKQERVPPIVRDSEH